MGNRLHSSHSDGWAMDAWQHWWHGLWDQFLAQRKGVLLIHDATIREWWHRCYIFPIPGLRKRHLTTHPYSLSVTMLPHECSALSHCSLDAGWSRPRPFHSIYLCGQTGRVMTLPGNLKTWHPQCSLRNSLVKENKHLLLIPFGEKEIRPSQYSFNWHLRH